MLTFDLGNSRLKACRWSDARSPCTGRWEGTVDELDGLVRWLVSARDEDAALASVAGHEITERVCACVREHIASLRLAPDSGLDNRCREPERVGQDRLYAAAGAAALLASDCVVVDAGTALTVDALRMVQGRGSFLGGAIAPGPELAAAALHAGTARLPRVELRPGVLALGTNTEDAIRAGVAVGFRGAAGLLVERLAFEAGLGAAPVVLTGGALEFLLLPEPFTVRRLHVVPDLVHRGLLAALERA
ncbi:MAG: type III pantothenate kinase [Planctomycetes bacterium]|nr:type III pantothenate kinase [Planctomycetota bacterium]